MLEETGDTDVPDPAGDPAEDGSDDPSSEPSTDAPSGDESSGDAPSSDDPTIDGPVADEPTGAPTEGPPAVVEDVRPDLPSGGYLEASRFVSADEASQSALAELWSGMNGPAEPGRAMYDIFPEDACFSIPGSATTPTFYDFVDVGQTITLRAEHDVELARENLFSNIFYRAYADNAAVLEDDTTYDVAYSGGQWPGALRMPATPVVNAPTEMNAGLVIFPPSGELEVSFQPTGADRVYLILQRDDDGVVCRLEDDGHFVVDGPAIAGAPEWGTLVLLAMNRTFVEHEGRAVEIVGTAGVVATFER